MCGALDLKTGEVVMTESTQINSAIEVPLEVILAYYSSIPSPAVVRSSTVSSGSGPISVFGESSVPENNPPAGLERYDWYPVCSGFTRSLSMEDT